MINMNYLILLIIFQYKRGVSETKIHSTPEEQIDLIYFVTKKYQIDK